MSKTTVVCCGLFWSVCAALSCLFFIFLAAFLGDSVNYVGYNEYGIDYNKITKEANMDKVYLPGRYVLGVGHKFLKYPSRAVTMDFSPAQDVDARFTTIRVQTSDGFPVFLDISAQYIIPQDKVMYIFERVALNYDSLVRYEFREAVYDVASRYFSSDFFSKRIEIAEAILREARQALPYVRIIDLQLSRIQLPERMEATIVSREEERQNRLRDLNLQRLQAINSETDVIVASLQRKKDLLFMAAEAEGLKIYADALAQAITLTTSADEETMEYLKTKVGFSEDQIAQYKFISEITQNGLQHPLTVDLKSPAIIPARPALRIKPKENETEEATA